MSLQQDQPGLMASRGPSNEESIFLRDTQASCSLLTGFAKPCLGEPRAEREARTVAGAELPCGSSCPVPSQALAVGITEEPPRGGARRGSGSSWRWFWWRGKAEVRPDASDGWMEAHGTLPSLRQNTRWTVSRPRLGGAGVRPAAGVCPQAACSSESGTLTPAPPPGPRPSPAPRWMLDGRGWLIPLSVGQGPAQRRWPAWMREGARQRPRPRRCYSGILGGSA